MATKTKSAALASANAFIGRATKPGDRDVASALGAAKGLWDRLVAELKDEHGLTPEWNTYSVKAGWSLRLKQKDRNIVYLGPCAGCFRVALILGDKAMRAAQKSELPKAVVRLIATAKRYPEGTAIRMPVNSPQDLDAVLRLARIKIEN